MMHAYTYTILRYVHDVTTGECLNVGVALYAPDARFAGAKCRTTYGRLSAAFPGMDGKSLTRLLKHIQREVRETGDRLRDELAYEKQPAAITQLAQSILPKDDSSLQWSSPGGGLTMDPAAELEKLYDRMVARYDAGKEEARRSDEDVWKEYRDVLDQRNVLQYLKPKRFTVHDDEVEFKHAWKNGVWHCLEPLSFDLSSADGIRDKAHRWLGQLTSVKDAVEKFKIIFLLGRPQEAALARAFERAKSILGKFSLDTSFIEEEDQATFAAQFAKEIQRHEQEVHAR